MEYQIIGSVIVVGILLAIGYLTHQKGVVGKVATEVLNTIESNGGVSVKGLEQTVVAEVAKQVAATPAPTPTAPEAPKINTPT